MDGRLTNADNLPPSAGIRLSPSTRPRRDFKTMTTANMVDFKTRHSKGIVFLSDSSLKYIDSSVMSISESLFCRHCTHSERVKADKSVIIAESKSAFGTFSTQNAVSRDREPREAINGPAVMRWHRTYVEDFVDQSNFMPSLCTTSESIVLRK